MRLLLFLLSAAFLAGCAPSDKADEISAARARPVSDLAISFQEVCALVTDETMPEADRADFHATLKDEYVEWDGYLVDESTSGRFVFGADRVALGGVLMIPPPDWTPILRELNPHTPLHVRGTLRVRNDNLVLEATWIELRAEDTGLEP